MKTLILVQRELSERVLDKKFILATILIPLFFGGIMVVPGWLATQRKDFQQRVAVIDGTGLGMAKRLSEELKHERIGNEDLEHEERLKRELEREEREKAGGGASDDSHDEYAGDDSVPRYIFEEVQPVEGVEPPRPLVEQSSWAEKMVRRAVFDVRASDMMGEGDGLAIKDVWNPAPEELKEAVKAGEYAGYVAFPPNLMEDNYYHYFSKTGTQAIVMRDLNQGIGRALRKERLSRAGMEEQAFREIISWPRIDIRALQQDKETGEGAKKAAEPGGAFMAFFLLYMTILLYGTNIMNSVIEDKQSRVAEVMLSTVSARQFLLGKIAGIGLAGTLQFSIWIGLYLIGVTYWPDLLKNPMAVTKDAIWLIVPSFAIGFTIYATFYAMIGAIAQDNQDAQQLQWFVVSIIVLTGVLMIKIISEPEAPLSLFLTWFPLTAPFVVPARMVVAPMPVTWLWAIGTLGVATCFLVQWLGGRIFRATILMHGKKPSFREVLGIILSPEAEARSAPPAEEPAS